MRKIIYELEVLVQEGQPFDGLDCCGVEQMIENCYPELQCASIIELSDEEVS